MKKIFETLIMILIINSCTLFPIEEQLKDRIEIDETTFTAYFIPGDATNGNIIQIRKNNNGKEKVIHVYEDYNNADIQLSKGGLKIILKYKPSLEYLGVRVDTFSIDLN